MELRCHSVFPSLAWNVSVWIDARPAYESPMAGRAMKTMTTAVTWALQMAESKRTVNATERTRTKRESILFATKFKWNLSSNWVVSCIYMRAKLFNGIWICAFMAFGTTQTSIFNYIASIWSPHPREADALPTNEIYFECINLIVSCFRERKIASALYWCDAMICDCMMRWNEIIRNGKRDIIYLLQWRNVANFRTPVFSSIESTRRR